MNGRKTFVFVGELPTKCEFFFFLSSRFGTFIKSLTDIDHVT